MLDGMRTLLHVVTRIAKTLLAKSGNLDVITNVCGNKAF